MIEQRHKPRLRAGQASIGQHFEGTRNAARQKIQLAVKVFVKRRSRYFRSSNDFCYRDFVVLLRSYELGKRSQYGRLRRLRA
jgi:hypothetical protein